MASEIRFCKGPAAQKSDVRWPPGLPKPGSSVFPELLEGCLPQGEVFPEEGATGLPRRMASQAARAAEHKVWCCEQGGERQRAQLSLCAEEHGVLFTNHAPPCQENLALRGKCCGEHQAHLLPLLQGVHNSSSWSLGLCTAVMTGFPCIQNL